MTLTAVPILILSAPLSFGLVAAASRFQPGLRPNLVKRLSRWAALIGLAAAAGGAWSTAQLGLIESGTLGWRNLGLSIRLDPLSTTMLGMIALLAWIILRFSGTYLDGDDRQGTFLGRLAATIAAVECLVLAGNLGLLLMAWVATSLSLHTLLVFYRERPRAVIAARKKFIAARLGDACLFAAAGLLYHQWGTGNLQQIFDAVRDSASAGITSHAVQSAAILIAVAAILKSAQFPTHGWLVEVMETPTPVSALLHAGILNAGPFLVTRMAFVMDSSEFARVLLILLGGFTALFASLTLLTQPAIKVALGYSSVAHMGFMLLVCGLGVYPAAMLHLVAHSFYKAHAFLSSGGVIDAARAARVTVPRRLGAPLRLLGSIGLALIVYLVLAMLWGIDVHEEPALLALGAILVMGLAQMIAPALDSSGRMTATIIMCSLSVAVATAFFSLEAMAHHLLVSVVPGLSPLGPVGLSLVALTLVAFASAVTLQILLPTLPEAAWRQHLAIHLRNGFYVNAKFDRFVGAFRTVATPEQNKVV